MSGSALPQDGGQAAELEGPMIQLYLWSDAVAPPMIVEEDGSVIIFHDYPELWNFAVNDHIHYSTRLGVIVYVIEKVEPANEINYSPEMRKVTARRKKT